MKGKINQVVEAQFFSHNIQTHLVNVSDFQNYEMNASLCFLFIKTFSCFQKKKTNKRNNYRACFRRNKESFWARVFQGDKLIFFPMPLSNVSLPAIQQRASLFPLLIELMHSLTCIVCIVHHVVKSYTKECISSTKEWGIATAYAKIPLVLLIN